MDKSKYLIASILVFLLGGLFSCTLGPKANLAIGQLYLGNPQKAWQMISDELENPSVSSQEDLCELHLATIRILEQIVSYDFAPDDPDLVAKKSYDYICTECQAFNKKIRTAENLYGNYLINTYRSGPAIVHYKRSLKLSDKDLYLQMCNMLNIGLCYQNMGVFELRDLYIIKAIELGREYFKTKRTYKNSLEEYNEWISYTNILQQRLDNLAWSENAREHLPEMHRLFDELSSINSKWRSKSTQYLAYHYASQRFAYAGDTDFARELYEEAKKLVEKYSTNKIETARLDLQSIEASILSAEGQLKDAAALYQDWIDKFQKVGGMSLSANDYRLAGLAQEVVGKYDLSIKYLENTIEYYEKLRSSFQVKSRDRVLTALVVTPYWGLIRSYAARYIEHRNEQDFIGAIRSVQKLRARQFGELLGISNWIDSDMDNTRLKLEPDELLLNIVLTDRVIVLFAISSGWHDLFIIPYDKNSFDEMVKRVKEQLSNPGHTDTLLNDLKSLSKIVLEPIEDKLDKFNKLIIIPDGMLNGIPFTLLSKSFKDYHPLILDYEISLTPSISYLIKNRSLEYQKTSDNLLALGDPAYGIRKVPETYQDETRGFYQKAVENLKLFSPLPETRTEVENIASLFQPDSVTTVYGIEASERKIKSLNLEKYRYIHFATHGILGNQIPGIDEPALVLAAESESSTQDGFLTLSEVEEMKLNSELAVLSACDTGSGKYYTGEGIMGLSRGFLLAGSRSVIVSLWPVASEETVELMTLFYKNLRSGYSKEAGLRLAQLAMMDNKNNKPNTRGIKVADGAISGYQSMHPFYWAPFVIIGG